MEEPREDLAGGRERAEGLGIRPLESEHHSRANQQKGCRHEEVSLVWRDQRDRRWGRDRNNSRRTGNPSPPMMTAIPMVNMQQRARQDDEREQRDHQLRRMPVAERTEAVSGPARPLHRGLPRGYLILNVFSFLGGSRSTCTPVTFAPLGPARHSPTTR